MRNEPHPVPRFIVMSAGTGGTSATIGRYIRCQAMILSHGGGSENSVFTYWQDRDASLRSPAGSKIEGIGRPRVEPSLFRMSWMRCCAGRRQRYTAHWKTQLGRKVGAFPTGTNMWELHRPGCAKRLEKPALS